MGGAALAQEETPVPVQVTRRIELVPEAARAVSEIMVSPGLSTMLLFDSELLREGVELEGRERFLLLDAGHTTIRVIPSSRAIPGERVLLTVRFQDGAVPGSASFLLRVHPARAEALVEVYREKRTLETYQQEAREARATALRCQEENARLLSERDAPTGLTGLLAADTLDVTGVSGRVLAKPIPGKVANGIIAKLVLSYRSIRRVAVEVGIHVKAGSAPWAASGATLKTPAGQELKVLRVWQNQPITPGSVGRVIVEAEATLVSPEATFNLKLWEGTGPRTVMIGNVTFPSEWD